MIIRLWPEHHRDAGLRYELLGALQRHRTACDEVWFCAEPGLPDLQFHRDSAKMMAEAADLVRGAGFLSGLQIGWTIGHGEGPYRMDAMDWQAMVGHDGASSRMISCPRAAGFLEYLAMEARSYCQWRPSSVWIDDDLRLHMHSPLAYGCFCDTCLAEFSHAQGRRWDRASLVEAMAPAESAPLRAAWVAFGQRSLALVARTIARAIRQVSPHTRLGYQQFGAEYGLYGSNWQGIYDALAEGSPLPVGSRPGGGYYTDHQPRAVLDKACHIARQVARLGPPVRNVCAEVENFTHIAMGKSAHGNAVESTLYLACGCNSLSYAILCAAHEPMAWYERLLERLAAWRPFWQRYVEHNERTNLAGMGVALGSVLGGAATDRRPLGWSNVNLDEAHRFIELGLPMAIEGDGVEATILHAHAIPSLSDEQLRDIFAGGVLTDGVAIATLQDRGLGDLAGVRATRLEATAWFERFSDDPLNSPHRRHLWRQFLPASAPVFGLEPASPQARVLGTYEDATGRSGPPATLAALTPGGGRLGVLGYNGWAHVVSGARRWQVLSLADWISPHGLPVLIEPPEQVAVFARTDPAGAVRSVLLLNLSCDATGLLDIELRVPTLGPTGATVPARAELGRFILASPLDPDQPIAPTGAGPRRVRLTLPSLGPYGLACLLAEA